MLVIDGSKQPINSSLHTIKKMEFYSAKKRKHSINVLVVIDITGRVIWISRSYPRSYPRSYNDNKLMKKKLWEFLGKITKNEFRFGDYRFSELMEFQIALQAKKNSLLFRITSSYKIKVKNTFAWLKDWKLLCDCIRQFLNANRVLEQHNMCWVIVSVFVNDYC